jgi:hypothetical protein
MQDTSKLPLQRLFFKCIFLFIFVFSGRLRGTQKWYSHPWKEWMKKKSKGLVLYFTIND